MLPSLSRHGSRRSIGRGVGMLVRPTSRAACGSGQPGPRSPVVSFSDYSRDRNQSLHVAARTRPQDRNFTTTTRVGVPDEIRHAACVGAFRDDSAPGVTVDVHNRRSCWGWFKWFLKIGGPRSKSDILLSR